MMDYLTQSNQEKAEFNNSITMVRDEVCWIDKYNSIVRYYYVIQWKMN